MSPLLEDGVRKVEAQVDVSGDSHGDTDVRGRVDETVQLRQLPGVLVFSVCAKCLENSKIDQIKKAAESPLSLGGEDWQAAPQPTGEQATQA